MNNKDALVIAVQEILIRDRLLDRSRSLLRALGCDSDWKLIADIDRVLGADQLTLSQWYGEDLLPHC